MTSMVLITSEAPIGGQWATSDEWWWVLMRFTEWGQRVRWEHTGDYLKGLLHFGLTIYIFLISPRKHKEATSKCRVSNWRNNIIELGFVTLREKIVYHMIFETIDELCDRVRNFEIWHDFWGDLPYVWSNKCYIF